MTVRNWTHILHTWPSSEQQKSDVFHKYLKPPWRNCVEKDPSNWGKYLNQVLAIYRVTPNLAMADTPYFLVYGRDLNVPLHQLLEPIQWFLGDPFYGLVNLEVHCLALAIAKSSRWKFKIGDRVYFKNKTARKMGLEMEAWILNCLYWVWWALHSHQKSGNQKTRPCNVKDIALEPPAELCNIDMQFGRAGKFINHPTNLPTITLADWKWTNSCT